MEKKGWMLIHTDWILIEEKKRCADNRLEHAIVQVDRRDHAHHEVMDSANKREDENTNNEDGKNVYARVRVGILPPCTRKNSSFFRAGCDVKETVFSNRYVCRIFRYIAVRSTKFFSIRPQGQPSNHKNHYTSSNSEIRFTRLTNNRIH